MQNRKLLGEILREKGIITEKTVLRTLNLAKRFNKRLGTILEETGLITGEELAEALALQYGYRVVGNFAEFSYPATLLSIIPVDVAMENMLFPLKIEGDRIALAMADPTDTRIVSNIAENNGLKVVPFIATRKDIIAAISRHYMKNDPAAVKDKTILLAEDDNALCTTFSQILAKEGYRIITALNGMEAYKLAVSGTPQVILSEKCLPKLDGDGLFEALKNLPETRLIPVILMADDTDPEDEARAFERGFFDFLTKPVKDVTLKTRVKRAFQFYERQYGML